TDVRKIQRLVNFYAKKDEMLPLSLNDLYDKIRDFYVYEQKGKVIGCGALHISWERLGEIRSLAVQKGRQKKGIGRRIVKECIKEARNLGLEKVFVLTYKPEYFRRFGFKDIDKYQLPHKVWTDCVKCVHFPDCTEDALIKVL
ncbi:MAG: N-acetyltransferase, partial [Candidatus Omnitrophica bacterium]|nr:N-acetyltransferase [Candidatus Omnitrophota bacterium]MCG2705333.1 N-acetyltransferase [Candidatus Omnitrophota bacterium]